MVFTASSLKLRSTLRWAKKRFPISWSCINDWVSDQAPARAELAALRKAGVAVHTTTR
jgi:hypothetical protein